MRCTEVETPSGHPAYILRNDLVDILLGKVADLTKSVLSTVSLFRMLNLVSHKASLSYVPIPVLGIALTLDLLFGCVRSLLVMMAVESPLRIATCKRGRRS